MLLFISAQKGLRRKKGKKKRRRRRRERVGEIRRKEGKTEKYR